MNDVASTGRDHRGQNGATHQKRTDDVNGEHAVPVRQGEVENSPIRIVAGGTVDRNMNGRKFAKYSLRCGFDISLIAHVATYRKPRLAIVRPLTPSFRIKIDARDGNPSLCKGERDCASDPLAGTGNHRHFCR